jgi:hypothetical protein
MQYHYMVMYDDKSDSWHVDQDTLRSVMTDGTVYDKNVFPGWSWPEEGSHEEALDHKCWQMLQSLVPIWPSPMVNGEL